MKEQMTAAECMAGLEEASKRELDRLVTSKPFKIKGTEGYYKLSPKDRKAARAAEDFVNEPAFVQEVITEVQKKMLDWMCYGTTKEQK